MRVFLHVHNATYHACFHWYTAACSPSSPASLIAVSHPTFPNLKTLIPTTPKSALPADFPISVNEDAFLVQFSPKTSVTLFYFLSYPVSNQIILWTVPSQNSQTFLTLSLLLILIRAVICSPLDYCNSTVALNEALFSNPNRRYLSMNGDFFCHYFENGILLEILLNILQCTGCAHETEDYLVKNASSMPLRNPAIASSQFAPNILCFKKELITLLLQILQYLPMVLVILIITCKALDNLGGPISDHSRACSQPK